ncbi:MAG: YgaP family membrane protein, partial [Bacillota bacterium]
VFYGSWGTQAREVRRLRLCREKNLGTADRVIRTIAGFILLGLVVTGTLTGWWASVAAVLALFQFIEALFAY